MNEENKNILFYGVLAAIIIAAFSTYLYLKGSPIYNVSVSLSEMSPQMQYYPYQTSQFNITVYNNGSESINSMLVNFYVNNSIVSSYKVSLPPHEKASITANYTYASAGEYGFQAIADPAKLLNIQNRSRAQASISIDVLPAAVPQVYTSIPNNGINYTQAFSISGGGMAFASFLSKYYNISILNGITGIPPSMVYALFSDLHSFVVSANGEFSTYANGSKAYSLWLQGYLDKQTVDEVLGTFRTRSFNTTLNSTAVTYYVPNNRTSICTLYSGGWTKIISYYNNSNPGTCLLLISENSNSTISENSNSTESAFLIR
ncbi:MAG: CARDB domain-containing protein, partial [Candidatus Micrarchaeaceae archaeon]